MAEEAKITVMRIHSKQADNYCIVDGARALQMVLETHFPDDVPFEDYNPDEVVTITFEQMTQAEIDALPEMETLFD